MLKKQTHTLSKVLQNINIDGLIQQFEKICLFDSNKNVNESNYLNVPKLLAIGSTRDFKPRSGARILAELQSFFDQQNGWVFGYLTYDLKNEIEELSSENKDEQGFPILEFFSPKFVFQFSEDALIINYDDEFTTKEEVKSVFELCFSKATENPEQNRKMNICSRMSRSEYLTAVNTLKEHIRKGNIYEVNFCQEFYAKNVDLNTSKVYEKLNTVSAAPFSSYCKFGHHYLMCASPERFLQKIGNTLISQPIKGTIKRSADPLEDEKLKKELLSDIKERSENVMIVDLVRNDLSRIAIKGSVKVEELFGIYSFRQVHQMISTVSCEVGPETSFTDILKCTYPMGSMTGAPKISAMKLIEEFEKNKRGLYSGAVGYIDPAGNFDFNVVIRSILYNAEKKYVSFMAGSAITDKSIPEKEYDECLLKAKAMFDVLSSDN